MFSYEVIGPEWEDHGKEGAPESLGNDDANKPSRQQHQPNKVIHASILSGITPLAETIRPAVEKHLSEAKPPCPEEIHDDHSDDNSNEHSHFNIPHVQKQIAMFSIDPFFSNDRNNTKNRNNPGFDRHIC